MRLLRRHRAVKVRQQESILQLAPARHLGLSGVTSYVDATAVRLACAGSQVTQLELRPDSIDRIACVESNGLRRCKLQYRDASRVVGAVLRLVARDPPVIVHSHDDSLLALAVLVARQFDAKVVHTVHYVAVKTPDLIRQYRPHTIAVSSSIEGELLARGVDATSVQVIRNFAETRWSSKSGLRLRGIRLRRRHHISDDRCLVLFAGRANSPTKGADLLVRSIPLIRSAMDGVVFAFAGTFWQPPEIQRLVDRYASEARLLGTLSRARLYALYAVSHVVVMPSRYEPLGMVALESQAIGTPVVASSVGGLPEIVNRQAGMLLATGVDGDVAPTELASAVVNICRRDEETRRALALKLVHWTTARFSAQDHLTRLRSLYCGADTI